jgi:hypothetical protein
MNIIKIRKSALNYLLDNQPFQADIINIILISFVWVIMIVLVNPIGDFPLNDDWAYGWSVKTLLETGDFQISDWAGMNLLPQTLWGALFCLPFGFSFTALRFSTLTLGLVGVLATYGLLREVRVGSKMSLLGAFIVALNPLYFALSNSFMTDIPSFTFTILSLYFLMRGLRRDENLEIVIGILFSFISILNRQSGLVIFPAFGLAYLVKKGVSIQTFIKAFFPTILAIFFLWSYSYWLKSTGRTPLFYNFQIEKLLETFSAGFFKIITTYSENLWIVSVYLGLFLFPFLIIKFSLQYQSLSARQKQVIFLPILFVVAIIAALVAKYQPIPWIGNYLLFLSIGPQTLSGYSSFNGNLDKIFIIIIYRVWQILTIIGVVGAALLFNYLLMATFQLFNKALNQAPENKLNLDKKWELVLLTSAIILYFITIGALEKTYWFDRYLILFLPLLMVLASISTLNFSKNQTKFNSKIACISLILLLFCGGFTISATHDYLSWNRVRWQALNNLMQDFKISPNQINGGFEFNGWYFGNRIEICNPEYQKSAKSTSLNWNDFTCLLGNASHQYILAFVPPINDSYNLEGQYSFRSWLPWREQNLYIWHNKTNSNNPK